MVGFHLCNILEMAKLQTENRVVASWFLEVRDEAVRVEGGRSGAGGRGLWLRKSNALEPFYIVTVVVGTKSS